VSEIGVLEGNIKQMIDKAQSLRRAGPAVVADRRQKVLIALPTMTSVTPYLVPILFNLGQSKDFRVYFHLETEVSFHSFARNKCVRKFLESDADYIFFIDSDTVPPPNALDLAKLDKDIVSGAVGCWLRDKLLPSIWMNADCEQCVNWKQFEKDGTIHDDSQYLADGKILCRWNPFKSGYQPFYERGKGFLEGRQCRCHGTGLDPWVFRVHRKIIEPKPFNTEGSVGAAMLMIRRNVLEKMPWPPFRFLFKESEEILLGEDQYFCWMARKMGFEVWAHPQMIGRHIKMVDLRNVNDALVNAFLAGADPKSPEAKEMLTNAVRKA